MEKESHTGGSPSDHMANERTFLAWVRTGIAIMTLGFVVSKFSLFVKQLSILVKNEISPSSHGYSSIIGIILVVIGTLVITLSYMRFKKNERQLEESAYHQSSFLMLALTFSICLISAFLILYLLQST